MGSKYTYKISDDVAYRVIGEELVVIEAESGISYYFDAKSKAFFDQLQEPCSLASVPDRASIDLLVAKKILVPCEADAKPVLFPENFPSLHVLGQKTEPIREANFFY